jgi:uncharacterized protein YkwD
MRTFNNKWRATMAGAIASCFLVACGGGGGGSNSGAVVAPNSPSVPTTPVTDPNAPVLQGNIAIDGRNWINYRRGQLGVAALTNNTQISTAAQAHSDYQKANTTVTHDETTGNPGFTGVHLLERLTAAGYPFNTNNNYAYGEVISATTNNSGAYMAEELVTAIYHRFVMFEPIFKEIGTGAATTSAGYSYFTADLTANNNYGTGVGTGKVVTWPFSGQTGVTPNFFSDFEAPDPVPNANEIGYPISVHGDITAVLTVQTFTVREHGAGADLAVRLLRRTDDPLTNDPETPKSAAAIIPLAVLKAGTTYDVTFVGTADAAPVSKSWSFTTK